MVGLDNPQDDQEAVRPGPSFVVISGGTGGNAICTAFQDATYVLPVSDDGGSSSEIIRVLGGPSIGIELAVQAVPCCCALTTRISI